MEESIQLAVKTYKITDLYPNEENYKNIRFEVESITNKINALRNHFLK